MVEQCNLLDIGHEPTDAQLKQLMGWVKDSVEARARDADARFHAHLAEAMRLAQQDVTRLRRVSEG